MLSLLATSLLLAAAPVDAADAASASNEIAIARQALRDGLWDVARQHAGNAGNGEGLLILLESFARGGKWDEVLSVAGSQDGAARQEIAYYRALALYKTGRGKDAADVLAAAQFEDESYRILGKRLEAMMRAKQQEAAKEAEKATDRDKKAQIVAKKQREAAEEERKLMQPLEKEIFAAIRTVSRAKGCDVVCEMGAVIMGGVDITQDVVAELKKKK